MRAILSTGLVLAFVMLASCSSKPGAPSGPRFVKPALETSAANSFRPAQISNLVVYPLQSEPTAGVSPDTLSEMTHQLVDSLQAGTDIEVLNFTMPDPVQQALAHASTKPIALQSQALEAAKELKSRAALYGVVSRYQTSDGSALGASRPAAVAFQVWLVDTTSGAVVWTGNFLRNEEPLSENLFGIKDRFRDGFGYKDASSLAKSGFNDIAAELERERRTAEQGNPQG